MSAGEKGTSPTDTLGEPAFIAPPAARPLALPAAYVEVVRALGLLLSLPEVEDALRRSGKFHGARNLLLKHLAIARGES